MNKVKGYIFDYGGTLDTGGCHWGKMLWHAWEQAEMPVTEQQFRQAYVQVERRLGRENIIQPDYTFHKTLETKVMMEMAEMGLEDHSGITNAQIVSPLYNAVLRHTTHSREVLQQLPQPKVLVSNFYGNMSTVLQEFDLDPLFLQVVESAVVGIRKPEPRIFLLGVEALGLTPGDVLVVGDSIAKDILPAKEAGCQTAWLRGEQWTDDPVDEEAADYVFDDLSEIITI